MDRTKRNRLLVAGIVFWSIATAISDVATTIVSEEATRNEQSLPRVQHRK